MTEIKSALVVDDSKSARFAVRKQLESFGYNVVLTETAEEAIAYLQTVRPDVIFLDYTLPGADGFEVLQRIKKQARTVTIPVVICSSHEAPDFVQQARSRGAVDVMRKPPDPRQIAGVLQNVERAAAAFRVAPPVPASAPPAAKAPTAAPVVPPPAAAPPVPVEPPPPFLAPPATAAPPAWSAKVQSIRPPEDAIEQRVMQTLRDAMVPAVAAPPPAAAPTPPQAEPAAAPRSGSDAQLRKLAQDLYSQIGELKAQLAGLDSATVSPDQLREIVRREITDALSEVRDELLKAAKESAVEEAHAVAERAVMNAATRVSEQMAQSLLKTLGQAPASGAQKQGA